MSRPADLPKWVWDLVIALRRYEDEHAKGGACLAAVLALVPTDICDQAAAISAYTRILAEEPTMAPMDGDGPTIPGRSGG